MSWMWWRLRKSNGKPQAASSGRAEPASGSGTLSRNDAELAGLFVAAISRLDPDPPVGSPAWAVQAEILERFGTSEAYTTYRDGLAPDALTGHISNLKGHAFERWLEHHGDLVLHASPTFAGSDGVSPTSGVLVEAKAGSADYICRQRGEYPDEVDLHATIEGDGLLGVDAHSVSESEFSGALRNLVGDDYLADALENSIAFGSVLSAGAALAKAASGEVRLAEVPRLFVADVAGRTARVFVIGAAVTSGAPVLVAAGGGWLAYRNRGAVARLANLVRVVVASPTTKQVAVATGGGAAHVVRGTTRVLFGGLTQPVTRRVAGEAAKTATRTGWWGVKGGTKAVSGLGGFLARRARLRRR